jgi:CheY-like chemotaxis protein
VNEALRSTPEVVVCDIGLPGLDGYGVARLLRQDPRTSSVLLVALSGYAQPEDVRRAAEAGFDRHLAKPPDLAELTRILADCPSHSAHDSPGAPRPGPAAEHRAPDSDGVCKVLLVDDDAVLRDTLATVLRGEGLEVIEARNGHECLELIERGLEFNATLLDYRMPGMNGGQVFERLKAKGLGDAVILMTAASAAPEIAREHGFRQFVPKPFGMEDLLTVLGQIVSGSGCRSSEV